MNPINRRPDMSVHPLRSPLYILEGCDGSGKTTLAHFLIKTQRVNYFHFNQYVFFQDYLEALLPDGKPRILDRSWLSERPYGTVFRHGMDRFKGGLRTGLEIAAKEMWLPTVIWCKPPLAIVIDAWKGRKADEMLQTSEQLAEVYRLYGDEMTATILPVVEFDYTKQSYIELMERLG